MAHFHLATVVTISDYDIEANALYGCLYKVSKPSFDGLKDEEVYLFKDKSDDKIGSTFVLSDFFYLKDSETQKILIRCKVLYPLVYLKEFVELNVNFIKVKIDPDNPPQEIIKLALNTGLQIYHGKTGCSPLMEYNNAKKHHYDVYTGMLCFPDHLSSANAPYFAFCKFNGDFDSTKYYAHDDDPNYVETIDEKGITTLSNVRKDFTKHDFVH
jgi:hypothetical protein